jgi:hypothetical protein
MKHTLLLVCLCSALGLAQTNQAPELPNNSPNPASDNRPTPTGEGPFLRHLKALNSSDWNSTKKVGAKVAEDTGKVAATVAVIPAIPVFFVALFIHCSFHDCGGS